MAQETSSATDTLLALLESAKADLAKAIKEFERATVKKTEADLRVRTLEDAYRAVRGVADRSVRDYILAAMRPGESYSAADLLEHMKREGYRPNPRNPTAAIIVTAGRLQELIVDETTSPHSYRLAAPQDQQDDEF